MSTRRPKPPQRGTPAIKTAPEANSDAAQAAPQRWPKWFLGPNPKYGGATMIDYADIEPEADDD